jgi:acetoacetyl-CoA synthetase
VLDRFTQIEPTVLIAVDGYQYGGKTFDRRTVVAELQAALPTLRQTILVPYVRNDTAGLDNTVLWDGALASVVVSAEIEFEQLPFDHPLWVLYSSGTTGLPKPIVQGHGGILLEHAKATIFHNDLKPTDRFFWYTSTGWMMWNYMLGSLLSGATIIVYNGSPAYPDINALFALAEQSGMTYFGTSAAFVSACIKADIRPNQQYDLSAIRGVGSTGSPLTTEGFQWIYDNINRELALESLSGGTDLCTAFVGGARIRPIYTGEIQGASLGAKVQAFDDFGRTVIDEVGELVITEPMPSMPLYFWNDPDMARYKASYFEMFPGVWRHGDWIAINERGGCVIYGRSDSTINRQGIRMGTSEIYRVVEGFDDVIDSLIIDLEFHGRESYLPLFVVLRDGLQLDDGLRDRIRKQLRADVSPRHVPDDIFQVAQIPYTLSGKKIEVPIRKILLGMDVAKAANRGAMRNPVALDYFVAFAKTLQAE